MIQRDFPEFPLSNLQAFALSGTARRLSALAELGACFAFVRTRAQIFKFDLPCERPKRVAVPLRAHAINAFATI